MQQLGRLHMLGFDRSIPAEGTVPVSYTVRCSQCEALVICGTPCHEPGCPNERHRRSRGDVPDDHK